MLADLRSSSYKVPRWYRIPKWRGKRNCLLAAVAPKESRLIRTEPRTDRYQVQTLPFLAGDGLACNLIHICGENKPFKGPVLLVHGAGGEPIFSARRWIAPLSTF